MTSKLQDYANLIDCYVSGQMSEAQWQIHLAEDPEFRKYVNGEFGPGLRVTDKGAARDREFYRWITEREGAAVISDHAAAAIIYTLSPDTKHVGKITDHALAIAQAAWTAGWNARKQLDYEAALGIKPADWRARL